MNILSLIFVPIGLALIVLGIMQFDPSLGAYIWIIGLMGLPFIYSLMDACDYKGHKKWTAFCFVLFPPITLFYIMLKTR